MNQCPQVFPDESELNERIAARIEKLAEPRGIVPVYVTKPAFTSSSKSNRVECVVYIFFTKKKGEVETRSIHAEKIGSSMTMDQHLRVLQATLHFCECGQFPILGAIWENSTIPVNNFAEMTG